MTRLIDNPGAQKTVTVIVDRAVLVDLLRLLALYADEYPGDSAQPYYQLAYEVESGERGSLTLIEWEGRE